MFSLSFSPRREAAELGAQARAARAVDALAREPKVDELSPPAPVEQHVLLRGREREREGGSASSPTPPTPLELGARLLHVLVEHAARVAERECVRDAAERAVHAVSYTHLTLPTILLV